MNNSLFDYVNRLHELQNMFDDLLSYLFLGQASGSTLLGRELLLLLASWPLSSLFQFHSGFEIFFKCIFLKGDHLM